MYITECFSLWKLNNDLVLFYVAVFNKLMSTFTLIPNVLVLFCYTLPIRLFPDNTPIY